MPYRGWGSLAAMTASEERPEEPELADAEYPSGAEIDDDPPGVEEGDLDEDQPGLSEDPPQAD